MALGPIKMITTHRAEYATILIGIIPCCQDLDTSSFTKSFDIVYLKVGREPKWALHMKNLCCQTFERSPDENWLIFLINQCLFDDNTGTLLVSCCKLK